MTNDEKRITWALLSLNILVGIGLIGLIRKPDTTVPRNIDVRSTWYPETKSNPAFTDHNLPPPREAPPFSSAQSKWYEGGTLHHSTMKEWRRASYTDRLATCADFVIASSKSRGISIGSMDVAKVHAVALERAISAAGGGGYADNQTVSDIAAACMVLMDSNR